MDVDSVAHADIAHTLVLDPQIGVQLRKPFAKKVRSNHNTEVIVIDSDSNEKIVQRQYENVHGQAAVNRLRDLKAKATNSRIPVAVRAYYERRIYNTIADGLSIFHFHRTFIPVNVNGNHWAVIAIEPFNNYNRVILLDSLNIEDIDDYLPTIRTLLEEESMLKLSQPLSNGWTFSVATERPVQIENAIDCGVFSLLYIKYLCRYLPLSFDQTSIYISRFKMFLELASFAIPYHEENSMNKFHNNGIRLEWW